MKALLSLPVSQLTASRILPILLLTIEFLFALLVGFGFMALGADGGSWILGGIGAGAIAFSLYRRWLDPQAQPNRNSRKVGQLLVGLNIGLSMQGAALLTLAPQLPVFALIIGFMLLSSLAIGALYARLEKAELITGLLASVPGNIGVMASIAADYGGNVSLVSLVQLARFTAVILLVPLIAQVSHPHNLQATIATLTQDLWHFNLTYLVLLTTLLAITVIGVRWGQRIKLPVAAFLGSILVGILFSTGLSIAPLLWHWLSPWLSIDRGFDFPTPFKLPPLLNLIGQILLGITIGEYWGMNPRFGKRTLATTLVPVTLTLSAAGLAAAIAKLLTPWDWLTCLLVTSPGGSPEMILIALVLHHQVEVVTAGHLIRLFAINLSLPLLIAAATTWQRDRATAQKSAQDLAQMNLVAADVQPLDRDRLDSSDATPDATPLLCLSGGTAIATRSPTAANPKGNAMI